MDLQDEMPSEGVPLVQPGERPVMRVNFLRQVLLMSVAFFGLFLAFNTAQALQTSLNKSLGHWCLASLYLAFTLTAVIAPRVVHLMGPKLAMTVGAATYIPMILSNLKPSYYWSIPASVLVGLGAGLLWNGEGLFVGRCATHHARNTGMSEEQATSYFNGVFFSFFQFNGTVGLVIASVISLTAGSNGNTVLFVLLTAVAVLGVAVFFFLSHVPAPEGAAGEEKVAEVSLLQTLQLLADPRMLLLVPIIFYNGVSLGFFFGDYPEYRVKYSLGKDYVGFVMATFYLMNTIASFVWGSISARVGRTGMFLCATAAHVAYYAFFFFYEPPEFTSQAGTIATTFAAMFGGSVVFAVGDAVWESQIPALLQVYFQGDTERNAAMANLKVWQSLGFSTQFVLGLVLQSTFWVKMCYLGVGMLVSVAALLYADVVVAPRRARTLLASAESSLNA